MNIQFDEKQGIFKLDTPNTSYCIGLAEGRWPGQVYYGPRIDTTELAWAMGLDQRPNTPGTLPGEAVSFFDRYPWEYPVCNMGDFRSCCLAVRTEAGEVDFLPEFAGYSIVPGKILPEGLPGTGGGQEDCASLILRQRDPQTGMELELIYTAYGHLDVITRSARIRNGGNSPVRLDKALSASLTIPWKDSRLLRINGSWAREQCIDIQPIGRGFQGTGSARGISSHQDHPFLAVLSPDATQDHGRVYAMHFVYSGSFLAQVERDQFDQLRMVMGIHPETFCWKLTPGETFQTPEVVMVCSDRGLGHMTRTLHDLYRTHLIPNHNRKRPVLLNSWEAVYFDFNEEVLLNIARSAAALGIELFVMDDGWFGKRDCPSGSLGDWIPDPKKLPRGLDHLSRELEKLGMELGIWMEPEMVSPDSDLYRAHPDWAIQTRNRLPMRCRDQYVLDLSRPEVEAYVYQAVETVLRSARITYLKWDMNRPLTNLGSAGLEPDRQGELTHRYVMALYRIQKRLTRAFPDLLLENCCSGGGRFDPGMLSCSPQIWGSDDSDAYERLKIQEGLSLVYPLSAIGAHVADCPNHVVGRTTPFETRAIVAMAGTFGYELDVTKLSREEQEQIPGQIARYQKYQDLIRQGDYYRLASARTGNLDAYLVVKKDRSQALLTAVRPMNVPNSRRTYLPLAGLDPSAVYRDAAKGVSYSGQVLMHLGYPLDFGWGDHQAILAELVRE